MQILNLNYVERKQMHDSLIDNMLDGSIGQNIDECQEHLARRFGERYGFEVGELSEELEGLITDCIDEVVTILAREASGDWAGWAETVEFGSPDCPHTTSTRWTHSCNATLVTFGCWACDSRVCPRCGADLLPDLRNLHPAQYLEF